MYSLDKTTSRSSSSTDLCSTTSKRTSTSTTIGSTFSSSSTYHEQQHWSQHAEAAEADGEGSGEIRLNPTTGRPLRNTTPYGRHSNDWLFGSVRVHKSIAKRVKKVVGAKKAGEESGSGCGQ